MPDGVLGGRVVQQLAGHALHEQGRAVVGVAVETQRTQLADRHYIIEQGCIVHEAGNAEFLADEAVKDRYLGVGLV